ncbi:hypothetical protein [Flavobacterium chungangense]|uniref:Uncharacterized protein n=1 Tax=Flavobacterium chungangense TaxID=554283 RepID=A0A6V6Z8V4_9FLAO|nr:hypothetical protein [Flavobacterium chungangense]CAD0007854.1 hypothetical protein FLACHUCJ7_03500 [Flavobacterium chungangense]
MSELKYQNEDYTLKIPNDTVVGISGTYPAFRFRLQEIDKSELEGKDLICLISTTSVLNGGLLRTYNHAVFCNDLCDFLNVDTSRYIDPHYFFILESQENSADVIADIQANRS